MRLLLALLLLAGQSWAAPVAGTTALYVDDLCSPENSGNDATANGYNLTTNGTLSYPTSGPTPAEGAYCVGAFSDANYYSAPAGLLSAWSNLTQWTWQAYVYPNSSGNNPVLCSWNDGSGGTENYILLQNTNKIEFTFKNVNGAALAAGSVPNSQWTHVAVTHDATTWNIYVAGTKVTSVANISTIGTVTALNMGRYLSAGFGFNGYLDQIRFTAGTALTSFPTTDPTASTTPQYSSPYMNPKQQRFPFITPVWMLQ